MTAPGRHKLHTQEGKNRQFKADHGQMILVDLSAQEKAQRALYKTLNFFPTPPWATRAIVEMIPELRDNIDDLDILEPAAGRGHIVDTLLAKGANVYAIDIHDYGMGYIQDDFLTARFHTPFDWVVMNPPFSEDSDRPGKPTIADKFIAKALTLAPNVLVFARLGFMTPVGRYKLITDHCDAIYVFCERVPIALGRISKKSGATDYAWYHFKRDADPLSHPATILIPPGTRARLTMPGDNRR